MPVNSQPLEDIHRFRIQIRMFSWRFEQSEVLFSPTFIRNYNEESSTVPIPNRAKWNFLFFYSIYFVACLGLDPFVIFGGLNMAFFFLFDSAAAMKKKDS